MAEIEREMASARQNSPEWLELFRRKTALIREIFEPTIRGLESAMQPGVRSSMPFAQQPALESVEGSLKIPKLRPEANSVLYRILYGFKLSLQFKPSSPEKDEEKISRLREVGLDDYADMYVKACQEVSAVEEVVVNFVKAHADIFNRFHSAPKQSINTAEFASFCVDLGSFFDQYMDGILKMLAHFGSASEEDSKAAREVLKNIEGGNLVLNFNVNVDSKSHKDTTVVTRRIIVNGVPVDVEGDGECPLQ